MTKGTTRRERKYRKKAVSVCKITSTSSNQNANANVNNNNNNNHHQEHGLLIPNILTSSTTTGTPSSQINNINNNSFSSPQLQINRVLKKNNKEFFVMINFFF